MTYPATIQSLIQAEIAKIKRAIKILSVDDQGSGVYVLSVGDSLYIQEGYTITIADNDYVVTAFDDGSITVTGSELPEVGTFNLYAPHFYQGTPRGTQEELLQENNSFNKTPFIWMVRNFDEVFYDDPTSVKERDSSLRIMFLTQADHESNLTGGLCDKYVGPMRKLCFNFIDVLKKSIVFDHIEDDQGHTLPYTITEYTKLGIYEQYKGYVNNILTDKLSGVELKITISVSRELLC